MGYTQYYTRYELTHDQDTWNKFLEDVQKVASRFNVIGGSNTLHFITGKDVGLRSTGEIGITICDGMGDGEPAKFTEQVIWFNGFGEDSHETLVIHRDDSVKIQGEGRMVGYYKGQWEEDKRLFSFTKTNRKPYDLLVTATLALYKHHFGDKVSISGDGGVEGYEEGIELVEETLGLKMDLDLLFPDKDED